MPIGPAEEQVIKYCQESVSWFMANFCKIKHPSAGILPFVPWSYQKHALKCFRQHRFNIFRKCFAAGTPIDTPQGPRAIETLRAGDPVYSYDQQRGQRVLDRVTAGWCSGVKEVVELTSQAGHRSLCTPDHQFLTTTGWVPAAGLYGRQLVELPGGQAYPDPAAGMIQQVRPTGLAVPVYDLEVAGNHNFLVEGAVAHNCRQAGISKISGIYALWFAMMHPYKTVLIVSRTDPDAMNFLNENIRLPFRQLPEWMQAMWDPKPFKDNEHEICFPNGSKIRSLSSHPDVLRSNASSLNIIDEAAFIMNMDALWAAGWSTLQHGGSVIAISTSNGVGNWYHSTWSEAEAGVNKFNAIRVNWWDMDWVVEYRDPISGAPMRIAPTDGLRRCETSEEVDKYGEYWSPWLEEQYLGLQAKGEAWKFEQEVLARFIGSGNTVLPKQVLFDLGRGVKPPVEIITGMQTYVHPVSGKYEQIDMSFPEEEKQGLWIWERPIQAVPDKLQGRQVIERGRPAHTYVMGVDLATGKGRDYQALEVFDVVERRQVAELMCRCLPCEFEKMVDWVGRYYNAALAVVERNNGGDIIIDNLRLELRYPRLWRRQKVDDRPRRNSSVSPIKLADYGFMTSSASKPELNKFLLDFIRGKEDDGFQLYSQRLIDQLNIYVRKRDRSGRDTYKTEAEDGPGNHDDLVIACALALRGAPDSVLQDASTLVPTLSGSEYGPPQPIPNAQELEQKFIQLGGPTLVFPLAMGGDLTLEESIRQQLESYAAQLGAGGPAAGPAVVARKHQLQLPRQPLDHGIHML